MSKLFVDVYDESGDLKNLVYDQPIIDPQYAHAEALELFRNSSEYRPNDYISFTDQKIDCGEGRFRINIGNDRYLLFWLQD